MSLQEVIDIHGINNIGLDSYPVLGEEYRTRLNDKIVQEYLNREIGHETVSLWRHAMRRKMNQIMPVYNKLYASETLIVDPLRTVDLHTLTTTNTDSESSATVQGSVTAENTHVAGTGSTSRQVGSDTPQVFLSGNGNYASTASDGRSDSTVTTDGTEDTTSVTNNTGESNTVDVMDSSVTGFQGNQAQLLNDYRATILNIDMLIVNELESLFMGIWNNGDSYYKRRV